MPITRRWALATTEETSLKKIFISYRRAEAEYAAGALGRELRAAFGEDLVFRDKENIGGGVSWKREVLQQIAGDSALLVCIGKDWINARDAQGRRRLDDEHDPMRLEIADGIRDGARILPILLEDAAMPAASELPGELQILAELNARRLRDSDWSYDFDRICTVLGEAGFRRLRGGSSGRATSNRGATVMLVVSCLLFLMSMASLNRENDTPYGAFLGFDVVALGLAVGALVSLRQAAAPIAKVLSVVAIAVSLGFGIFNGVMAAGGRAPVPPAPAGAAAAKVPGNSAGAPASPSSVVDPEPSEPSEPAGTGEDPQRFGSPKELIIGTWRLAYGASDGKVDTTITYLPDGTYRGFQIIVTGETESKGPIQGTWKLRVLSPGRFTLTTREKDIDGAQSSVYRIVSRDVLRDEEMGVSSRRVAKP